MINGEGGHGTPPFVRFFIVLAPVAVLISVALFPMFQVLEIGNGDAKMLLCVSKGDVFAHGYTHSMYGAPVFEKFKIENGCLRLFHVMTESDAVLEYFAIEKKDEPNAHGTFKSFSIPSASIGQHRFTLNGREIPPITPNTGSAIPVTLTKVSLMTHFWR